MRLKIDEINMQNITRVYVEGGDLLSEVAVEDPALAALATL